MYLKNYDLSEKRVADDVAIRVWSILLGTTPYENIVVFRAKELITVTMGKYAIEIWNNGIIVLIVSGDIVRLCRNNEANHILLETQWIDPKVELPEDENEKVIIKYSDDDNIFIITGFLWKTNKKYLAVGSAEDELFNTEYDKMDIIGWLPAENVVM